jgi:uncharacterized protein
MFARRTIWVGCSQTVRACKGITRRPCTGSEWPDQGLAEAQTSVGWMYGTGIGVPKDYVEAVNWYKKAAAQDFASAQFDLGVLYTNGLGISQDYAKAAEWYRKAADQGYPEAQLSLGNVYRLGIGVPQDYVQS